MAGKIDINFEFYKLKEYMAEAFPDTQQGDETVVDTAIRLLGDYKELAIVYSALSDMATRFTGD